jgi:hypothetical protein
MEWLAFFSWSFLWLLGGAMQMAIQSAVHNTIQVSSRPQRRVGRSFRRNAFAPA